jgi:hypothetical protein
MKETPMRIVCNHCRQVTAESKYDDEKGRWIFEIVEECCSKASAILSGMHNIKERDEQLVKEGYEEDFIEPSFYSWESNR